MGTQQQKSCVRRLISRSSRSNSGALVTHGVLSSRNSILSSWAHFLLLFFMSATTIAIAGCGSGGYPGGSLNGLSANAVTLDAGQSYQVTAELSENPQITWALSGTTCSTTGCGTVSGTTGVKTIYTAPAGVTAPIAVTLTAAVSGTSNSAKLVITVNPDPTLNGIPANGTVGVAYAAALNPTGGTAPLTLSVTSGTLPPGVTFNATTGALSGTPTTVGTYSFTVQLTDSSAVPYTLTKQETIVISSGTPAPTPLTLTVSSLPDGTVNIPYSQIIGVAGGTAPYSCSIQAGTLPTGLSLNGCVVSGTPTVAGTVILTVHATDSSSPAETVTGPVSLTIHPAGLTITTGTLPNGTVGVAYSSTIGVSGGTTPYTCTIVSGTLPAGLAMNSSCVVSGTPTVAGTSIVTVKVNDSSNPIETAMGPVSITINSAPATIVITSPPAGTVNVQYTGSIGVSGGTAPYTCAISGALPAGLTASNCTITGTPTTAGSTTVTVTATDSSNPKNTGTGPATIVINSNPTGALTITSPPAGTINTPYAGTIGVSGGTAPYTCTISGALPAGLTASNCNITGTPTTAGSTTVTVTATDGSNPQKTGSGPATIVINSSPAGTLTLSSPQNGTVNTPYTGSVGVNGGIGLYTCTITGLPAGLTSNSCAITGTPTAAGTSTLTVTATDSTLPTKLTTTGTVTLTINPIPALTLTGTLPNATLGVPYSQTLTAQGGIAPYTYAVTSGSLPTGLTLNSTTGVVSGTPTAVGAYSFTVTATDSESPVATASKSFVMQVLYPCTANCPALNGPYALLIQGYDDVVAGVLAYQTATVASFTADGAAGINSGEMDSNHQSSSATGTLSSFNFLGTYTIGPDYRGSLALTKLNSDGTVGATTTYAISVKAPVSPATATVQGTVIEADDNQLVGTKGSGTLLQQTPTSFTTGLTGSYAFGMQGDTPCIVSCTVNLGAGPVVTVGEFTTDGAGAITNGDADNNIAATTIANAAISGTYTTADANGRMQLTLSASGSGGTFPTDYAVYMVNANQAFIVSTDTHAAFILQAGTLTSRTQTTFSNASLNGPFIGYENSYSNPGLVGALLQNVLNLSTATIFRGVGASNATCNITNVDVGGVTGLLNGLTGILGSITGLSGLLGETANTGSTTCTVNANGRAVLQYPVPTLLGIPLFSAPAPRVLYLTSPNAGYFLETAYAGLGNIEAQTGAPFSEANTFTGSYIYGTTPASSLASIDDSGVIVSNGAGSATTTLDTNIGVGTINVIQLGNTSTQTYTAPDATTGRFTLGTAGTTVLYAITPNRFVLLDTSALTTSPSVSLLY
jgi:hypothetical protein